MNPFELASAVRGNLTPDLLKPGYGPQAHCYVASEALYHLLGGQESGFKPMNMRVNGVSHWWLRSPEGHNIDLTANQFDTIPDYTQGVGKGFLTSAPSKRARILMDRVRESTKVAGQGNRWVYLNGAIAYGLHYFQIADELARQTGIPEMEVSRITNKLARGDISGLDMYDLALGRMLNGRPYIEASTVDRNHVYDVVLRDYAKPVF